MPFGLGVGAGGIRMPVPILWREQRHVRTVPGVPEHPELDHVLSPNLGLRGLHVFAALGDIVDEMVVENDRPQ